MFSKSLATSDLSPLSENKVYPVPRAVFWILVRILFYIAPWIVILIVVDNGWWAFGPLFGSIGLIQSLLFHKTVKFVMETDGTVTHYGWLKFEGGIPFQTKVPLTNYEKIRLQENRVTFVKTDEYYNEIVARVKHCGCGFLCIRYVYTCTDSCVYSCKSCVCAPFTLSRI